LLTTLHPQVWLCLPEESGHCWTNSRRQTELLHREMRAFQEQNSYRMVSWSHPCCDVGTARRLTILKPHQVDPCARLWLASQCRKYIRLWAWRSCPGVNGTAFGSRREGTLALKGRAFRPSENAAITMRLSRCGIRLITIPLTPHTNSCRPMPSAHLLFWFPRGPTALPPPQPEGRNNNSPGRKPWVNAGNRFESLQGRHTISGIGNPDLPFIRKNRE